MTPLNSFWWLALIFVGLSIVGPPLGMGLKTGMITAVVLWIAAQCVDGFISGMRKARDGR